MSLIDVSHLSFAYDGSDAEVFTDVSFRIDTAWRLGFVGRNGRGKTTFLRLLCGDWPYRGTIAADVAFEYFPYAVPDPDALALAVAEEASGGAEYWRIVRELNLLELDEEALGRPFSTLSSGEQTKLLLAAMFLRGNAFLLIDEPTNHLDLRGRALVGRYLRAKEGFILVSHDRALLDECVDHILSINRANIEVQRGNWSSWEENKRRRDDFERAEDERLRRDVRRLRETAREKADWSDRVEATKIGLGPCDRGAIGHKAEKMMKRAKAIERRVERAAEEKEKLLKNLERDEALKLVCEPYPARRLVSLRGVSVAYGARPICAGVELTVGRGDRIALTGRNGAGKSSILKLVCGLDVPHTGAVSRGGGLKISYVPQDASGLFGSLRDYIARFDVDEAVFFAMLRKLDLERAQFDRDLSGFSAGQKKKVLLARSISERAHLYVWDEPLNYIDVISRAQLEELILRDRPTLLFVEHDRRFCERVATKTVELSKE